MGSTKRSIVVAGQKTSVSLEDEFWDGVKEIASQRTMTLSNLISEIRAGHAGNLSSAVRVYVLQHYHAEALRHRGQTATRPAPGVAA